MQRAREEGLLNNLKKGKKTKVILEVAALAYSWVAGQSFSQLVCQSQSISQSVSQSVSLLVNQSLNQSVSQPVSQSVSQSISQSVSQSIS